MEMERHDGDGDGEAGWRTGGLRPVRLFVCVVRECMGICSDVMCASLSVQNLLRVSLCQSHMSGVCTLTTDVFV